MSNVIKFGNSSIATEPGLESVNKWLFFQFSNFIRSDDPKVTRGSFQAKILEKQLKDAGFTESHANVLINNLDVIFTEIRRTALVVGEVFQVGVLGLVYGKTTTNDSHALTLNVVYEDWENLPFIHSFLITDVGEPGGTQDYITQHERRPEKAVSALRTNDDAQLSQGSIDAIDLYFTSRTDSSAGRYEVAFAVNGLSDRMLYNNALAIDDHAFLITDHLMFNTGLTTQYLK